MSAISTTSAIVSSTRDFLNIARDWHTEKPDASTVSEVAKATGHQIQKFAGTLDAALETAQKGFEAASDSLTWAQYVDNPEANKSEQDKYMKKMMEISKRGLDRSQNALNRFREVRQGMTKTLEQIKSQDVDAQESERQVLHAILDEFDTLLGWYIHWWTERNMHESGQNDRIGAQAQKHTLIGMSIVTMKWRVLKDGYSGYTEKMLAIWDEYPEFFEKTTDSIGNSNSRTKTKANHLEMTPTPSSPITTPMMVESTPNLEAIQTSTKGFFDVVRACHLRGLEAATSSALSKDSAHHIEEFAMAFNNALEVAHKGFTAASDGLMTARLSADIATDKSKLNEYMKSLIKISEDGRERSGQTLMRFREVRQGIIKVLDQIKFQEAQESHKTEPQGSTAVFSVLNEFETTMHWYIHWWTERMMDESGQNERIAMQARKQTPVGMRIVSSKWQLLKDDYLSYTEQMQVIQDEYPKIFKRTSEPIGNDDLTNVVGKISAYDVAEHRKHFGLFEKSTASFLRTVETWRNRLDFAAHPLPDSMPITRTLVVEYVGAYEFWTNAVQNGYNFSTIALSFAACMTPSISSTERESYIAQMQSFAAEGKTNSEQALEGMRQWRRNLNSHLVRMKTSSEGSPNFAQDEIAVLQTLSILFQIEECIDWYAKWWTTAITFSYHETNVTQYSRSGHETGLQGIQLQWQDLQDVYIHYQGEMLKLQVQYAELFKLVQDLKMSNIESTTSDLEVQSLAVISDSSSSIISRYSHAASSIQTEYGFYYTSRGLDSNDIYSIWDGQVTPQD